MAVAPVLFVWLVHREQDKSSRRCYKEKKEKESSKVGGSFRSHDKKRLYQRRGA